MGDNKIICRQLLRIKAREKRVNKKMYSISKSGDKGPNAAEALGDQVNAEGRDEQTSTSSSSSGSSSSESGSGSGSGSSSNSDSEGSDEDSVHSI